MPGKLGPTPVEIELNAVIVAVRDNEPCILIDPAMALPSGPFETGHRTLEQGLRDWAEAKGGQRLGYVEQLYTFADKDRTTGHSRMVSIGYLALLRAAVLSADAVWSPWYHHLPWEDYRDDVPRITSKIIFPGLSEWKNASADPLVRRTRSQRVEIAFPKDKRLWNEELVLQRYELLWEAGLVAEAQPKKETAALGLPMAHDHRRILATAIARLRAKIKYRPVVFELMSDTFTLLQLQNTVEALAGLRLHKQNFRRLVNAQGLVEETGAYAAVTAGRPAKLFAFRRKVLMERAVAGTKLSRTS